MDAGSVGFGRAVSEINVTPLIDVLLVLLIIFMVIVPAKPNGLPSQLPQPPTTDAPPLPATIVVEILAGQDGAPVYKINQTEFAREHIVPELRAIFAARQDKTIFVKGDPALTFEEVAQAIDMGRQAGVQNFGLMTPKSLGEQ